MPTLDEYFQRDPLTLTDAELDEIVAYYRQARAKFVQEEDLAKLQGRRTKAPKLPKDKPDLGKLEIDL